MPRPTGTARRYAEALFELARPEGAEEAWLDDLRLAAAAVADPVVFKTLRSPAIPLGERRQALDAALAPRLHRPARNLVHLILERGRLDLLPRIVDEYQRLVDEAHGILQVEVRTALPLTREEEDALRARMEALTGARVRLTVSVDPSLIGGLTVRVGDRLMDGSVRGRLERLRTRLLGGIRGAGAPLPGGAG